MYVRTLWTNTHRAKQRIHIHTGTLHILIAFCRRRRTRVKYVQHSHSHRHAQFRREKIIYIYYKFVVFFRLFFCCCCCRMIEKLNTNSYASLIYLLFTSTANTHTRAVLFDLVQHLWCSFDFSFNFFILTFHSHRVCVTTHARKRK